MPPDEADGAARRPARTTNAPPAWLRNAAVWVGVGVAVVVLVVLGVAVLPGWWAGLVGDWVHGVSGRGIPIGVGIGALFTVLPLGIGALAFRRGLRSQARIAIIVIALLLLLPNVLTTTIALGGGDARSMLAIAGPGFRGGTWTGIGLVVLALVAVIVIRRRSRRTRTKIDEAEQKAARVSRQRAAEVEEAGETGLDPATTPATAASDEAPPEPRTP
ncbi:hypothetical protein [Pseudactinotalea sp.]|uniref:hypothetical protein n=1 Tax=Pseudactinotalea sp. TaxID=1926260 RepID=UPI003B3A2EAA